ncbi:MAG: glucose ABC transporter substrate-binding protein GlcS, partial [Acidilobus sp.]
MHTSRRSVSGTVIAIIVIVVVVVAAIGGYAAYLATRHHPVITTTTTTTTTTTVTTPVTTTTTTPVTSITFYTWWATTGKVALNHFIPVFEKYNPPYTVSLEIIPGAGGTNAKFTIAGMMEAGKPPATFQVHFGPEMASYALITSPKDFVNFTPIAVKMGLWTGGVTEALLSGTFNGSMLSMPVDVHRGALLYINIKLLREYNLPLPTNLSTLIYDTVQLAQHGVTPWMVPGADGGWDQLNLWEDIFLALAIQKYGLAGGARLYNEFAYGTIDLANTSIQQLINETDKLFVNFTSYDYPGWQSLTWTQGLSDLIEGKVAFQANGDWLTTYAYDFLNTTTYPAIEPYISWPNVTVVVEPFPGTNGTYALVIDSVGVPQPYPTTEAGIKL